MYDTIHSKFKYQYIFLKRCSIPVCVFLFEKLLSMPIFFVFPFEITTRNNRNETKLTPIVSIVDIKILIPPIHQVEFYCFIYTNDKSKNCIKLEAGKRRRSNYVFVMEGGTFCSFPPTVFNSYLFLPLKLSESWCIFSLTGSNIEAECLIYSYACNRNPRCTWFMEESSIGSDFAIVLFMQLIVKHNPSLLLVMILCSTW